MVQVVAIGLMTLTGVACDDKIMVPDTVIPTATVTEVRIVPSTATLKVGEQVSMSAAVLGTGITNFNVLWSSTNPTVASVDNGRVTGVAPGTTSIRATASANAAVSGFAIVVVEAAAPVLSMSVTPSTLPFTHIIGSSPCPQAVGTIRIQNTSTLPLNITIANNNPALAVAPLTALIPAGETQPVIVAFNCATQTSFTTSLAITGTNGGNTVNGFVEVTATITR